MAVGQRCEHGVVVLPLEGDPDQAVGGGRQQQRADRAVDGAVGDVEQAGAVGSTGQLGAASAASLGAGVDRSPVATAVDGGSQVAGDPTVRRPGLRGEVVAFMRVPFR